MIWSSTTYALATLTTALIAGGLAALAWRRRTTPGGATFALLMAAVAWWALMGALEYSVVTVRGKLFFAQLSYLGIVSIGPLWYLFAAHYCGYDKGLTRWRVAALWALPVAILVAVATNSRHGLIWPEVSEVAPGSPNPILLYGHGPLFWVIAIYTYALTLIGTFILLWAAMQAPHVYRRQASMLAIAAVFPWVGNLLYVLGINPFPGLDLTLFAFMFAGAIVGYSMFRFQLFNILPVAQDALFTSLTDGVLIVDNQNRIIDINLAAQRMLGVPADVRGQPTTTVLAKHKDLAAPFQDLAVAQVRINNNTPNSRWVDVRVSPIIDRRGQIAGQLAVIQDITARKEVELALRQSEASYRGLFNSVAEAIYVQDGEGRFLDVNAGAVQMYGYPRKSLIGKTPEALGAPGRNDIKQVDSAVKRALAGEPQEFEFWGQRANGEVFPKDVRLYKATYFGKDVVIALAQDITERKLAEAALRESEARYRDLIQKQGEGIAVVDGNQRFVFVNPAAEQILGFEAGTLTGQSLRDILEPDQVEYAKNEWGPKRTHDSVEFELAANRRNGERRWLHITATPNLDSAGQFANAFIIFRDITDAKRITNENARLLAETQKRAERFAVISEIASALNSTLELNTVLQAVVDGLAHALGVEQTGLALFDEQHTHLTIVAEHAGPGIPSAVGSELPIAGNRSLEYVMSTRAPLYVADAQRDEIMAAVHPVMVQRQVRSILIVPLLFGDQVIGTIGSDSLSEPRAYTAEELWLASTLANLAAVRIHQAQLYSQVQQRTILDGLTQVYNYRGLMEIGAREFERGRRFRRPLSAVFVEIDRFRDFNNRYSHQVGNQVLCAVAKCLRENVREVDLLSRFGGDEFVVLLPETEVKFAVLLGEQLRSAVETMQVPTEHGALGVTVSIGVAGVRDDMQGIPDLIEAANRAEHAAKQRGRNRVAVIDSNGADALAPAYAGMALGVGR